MMRKMRWRLLFIFLLIVGILIGGGFLLRHANHQYQISAHPLAYADLIEKYADENGVSPSLVCAIICTESHFNPNAVSHAGAMGLMQLTPETYVWAQTRAGIRDKAPADTLFDPVQNIRFGTVTLRLLLTQFENTDTALAAYNAGQGNVSRWLKDPAYSADGVTLHTIPYKETAAYVQKVKAAQKVYQTLYKIP